MRLRACGFEMMSTTRLPSSRRCPVCGWRMVLVQERFAASESEHGRPMPFPIVFRYVCRNGGCEHEERAAFVKEQGEIWRRAVSEAGIKPE